MYFEQLKCCLCWFWLVIGIIDTCKSIEVAVAKGMAELQGEVEEGKADRIVTAELRRRVALLEEEEVANGVKRAEGQVK